MDRLASIPKTQGQAGMTVMLATAVTSLLSWGLGLVTAGVMARQIAK
ncbi:MAG: TIGR00366 family protein [Rubrobacter sp.]|nr:TIGR00366 family protein [Rubrobacter sp.]